MTGVGGQELDAHPTRQPGVLEPRRVLLGAVGVCGGVALGEREGLVPPARVAVVHRAEQVAAGHRRLGVGTSDQAEQDEEYSGDGKLRGGGYLRADRSEEMIYTKRAGGVVPLAPT